MMLNAVVLPAPFGPIRPTIWPSGTSRETPSRATIPPNRRVTLRSESSAIGRRSLFGRVGGCQRDPRSTETPLLSARGRTRGRAAHEPEPEDHEPARRHDSVRRVPRLDLLFLGPVRDLARPD